MRDRLQVLGVVLALAGLGIAAYLTYVHYSGAHPVCTGSESCVKVQTSEWSKVSGVPVAVLGLVGYAAILASLLVRGEAALLAGAGLALAGLGFSVYLTYREIWTIEAICIWCVASAIVMAALAIVTVARLLRSPTGRRDAVVPYVG